MPQDLDPLISAEQLNEALVTAAPLVLCDVRSGPAAAQAYAQGHLPGALHVDLDTQLSAAPIDAAQGGRHPLPDIGAFAALLGALGITADSDVIAYDDQGGANAAARLWWMLRAVGHRRVRVLDGGLTAAAEASIALSQEVPTRVSAAPYPARAYLAPQADIDDVARACASSMHRVLDVRAAARFRGEVEPIDPIAGHIPGAHNIPLSENLNGEGRFKSKAELEALYAPLLGDLSPEQLIVHCGSGVTACHTLLALERAGLSGAKLYVGSWSEWCRHPDRPRAP
jgi:thiosulfate/3-mercaptopyruvate sulfurtransferase